MNKEKTRMNERSTRRPGRPFLSDKEKTVESLITWTASQRELAKQIGGGKVSVGVRRLLEFYIANSGK
jgi:hypothetical protein